MVTGQLVTSKTELNILTRTSRVVMRMMMNIIFYSIIFEYYNKYYVYDWTSKTELNILTRTSRVVIRRPLRLETSSRGRRKLDQETATKNPVDANRSSL